MNDYNSNDLIANSDAPVSTIPKALNVLTILTFVGCGLIGVFTLLTPVLTSFMLKMIDKAGSSGQDLSAKQVADMEKSKHMMELTQANMIPIVLIGMLGVILCLVGAIMMRKLKKDGFWIYVAGQVVPVIGGFATMGTAQYTSVWSYLWLLIPALFIFLYSQQRKYMIK
jgi:hypothetical protein